MIIIADCWKISAPLDDITTAGLKKDQEQNIFLLKFSGLYLDADTLLV
jgi:hypothetical protein